MHQSQQYYCTVYWRRYYIYQLKYYRYHALKQILTEVDKWYTFIININTQNSHPWPEVETLAFANYKKYKVNY